MKKIFSTGLLLLAIHASLNANEIENSSKACDAGSANECYELGFHYYIGDDVQQNDLKAAAFFTKACNAGSVSGCINLADMYTLGEGMMKDESKANELYKKVCRGECTI